jgi:hypothetical protein
MALEMEMQNETLSTQFEVLQSKAVAETQRIAHLEKT